MNCELQDKVFRAGSGNFDELAIEVFRFQYEGNVVYRKFAKALGASPELHDIRSIPFMPVGFFKQHEIVTGSFVAETIFESSGTTNTGNSRHFVRSLNLYRESFMRAFENFYGPPQDWCIVALLPSYLERNNSSLVVMADELIKKTAHRASGFYLYNFDDLIDVLMRNESAQQKTLLLGVTFALLDLAERFQSSLKYTTVMETGGMKGRRKEITREEVHHLLKSAWQLPSIHSEYGMSELLSQAYSSGEGIFYTPPHMKVLVRDEDDPLTISQKQGLINVIDLANLYSCAFIATDDIGKIHPDGAFEVLGRMDSSDVRGCSLMYAG